MDAAVVTASRANRQPGSRVEPVDELTITSREGFNDVNDGFAALAASRNRAARAPWSASGHGLGLRGSTVQTRVTVIGGHEEESESGVTTLDSDFLTVLIRGFDCAGELVNDRGSGSADFTFSPSLQEATVAGTITTRDGRSVTVDVDWVGTGAIQATNNTTTFPGFTGHFQGKLRDAVATGIVVVDGETLVDGSTTNAEIETLEDTNISTGA